MDTNNLEHYFREQQMSLQWLPFLRAMASEMSEQTDSHSLRSLFSSIGRRFAEDAQDAFADISTLTALTDSLNDFLRRIDWGYVEIAEAPGGIAIEHYAAPLAEAFGDEALTWSLGFLEGFYQTLFGLLGASPAMRVRALDDECQGLHLRFWFGR